MARGFRKESRQAPFDSSSIFHTPGDSRGAGRCDSQPASRLARLTMIRGLMTDDEWTIVAPFLITPSSSGGRPPDNHRRVLDGALWICRTGAPWRDLPDVFGKWNSVWRQFRRWCLSGVWDLLLQTLADSGGKLDLLQMIDSTTVRAEPAKVPPMRSIGGRQAEGHRCAGGEKGGSSSRRSAARAAASPPRSIFAATPSACRSASC